MTTPEQKAAAVELRRLLAAEREVKDLVEIGAYVAGTNPDADRALALSGEIRSFLCQDMDEVAPAADSWARLGALVGPAMKRYTFSLAKVLRVRRIEEEQAAAQLGRRPLHRGRRRRRRKPAPRTRSASRCARGGLQPAVSFLAWAETAMLAGEALSDARAEASRPPTEEVADRRQEWSSAAARVSALEHLDERGREAHELERRREETKTTEDIVTTRTGSPDEQFPVTDHRRRRVRRRAEPHQRDQSRFGVADPASFGTVLANHLGGSAHASSFGGAVSSGTPRAPGPNRLPAGLSPAIDLAQQHLGVPYVWGGESPSGFDCSGLIQYVYGQLGVSLPRVAADQARVGQPVASLADARPGDLVAFNDPVDHIGIYAGNGSWSSPPRPATS